jgi:hypothetical protein
MPDELLQALPRLQRERILRDRDKVAERARRASGAGEALGEPLPAARDPRDPRRPPHQVDDGDGDFDFDAMFAAITEPGESRAVPPPAPSRAAASPPAAPPAGPPAPRPAERPGPPAVATGAGAPVASGPRSRPAPATEPDPPGHQPDASTTELARPAPPPLPGSSAARATRPRGAAPAPPAARPAGATPRPAARRGSADAGELPPGMTEQETRALFDRYVQAKRLVGDDTSRITYQGLLKTLNKQAPQILAQHKAERVEFNVVIKDDRVVLKAKPRK